MTRAATQSEINDHNRDLRKHEPFRSFDRCAAVAKLVGYAEAIAASGRLNEVMEFELRRRIAETLTAFDMPSSTERGCEHA